MIKYKGRPVCSGTAAGPVVVLRREVQSAVPGSAEQAAVSGSAEQGSVPGREAQSAVPGSAEQAAVSGSAEQGSVPGKEAQKAVSGSAEQGSVPVKETQAEEELERLDQAVREARGQLQELCGRAAAETGAAGTAIFEAHQMLLEDEEYLAAVRHIIRTRHVPAEYAVAEAGEGFARKLAGMEDEYLQARAEDMRDVSGRLARVLGGQGGYGVQCVEPSIIVADDLSPSETMQLDRDKILALVTVHGSRDSHTAILARMRNLPALTGVPLELDRIRSGMRAVVDGTEGEVVFEPDGEVWEEAWRKIRAQRARARLLGELRGKESVTRSGKRIALCANIGCVEDVKDVLENDGEGIGLMRSEFLYLGRNRFPTEEEQFQAYRQVLEAMGERSVVIRTLDMGADKQADYFSLGREENPALGYRGIRICLREPELFKVQLRALLRAAVYGNLSVMYPMITSAEEVERIYEIVGQVRGELEKEGTAFGEPRQGVMIETPAAVMISGRLAQMVDFFSVGTNDLTQYTLAADRHNERVAEFYNPRHEAVLRMIRMAADNAHRYGKRVGICGELGADPELAETFVKMGIDVLSVAPSMILPLRERIRGLA